MIEKSIGIRAARNIISWYSFFYKELQNVQNISPKAQCRETALEVKGIKNFALRRGFLSSAIRGIEIEELG